MELNVACSKATSVLFSGTVNPPRGAPEGGPGRSRGAPEGPPDGPRGGPERAKNSHLRSEMVPGGPFHFEVPRKGAAKNYSFYYTEWTSRPPPEVKWSFWHFLLFLTCLQSAKYCKFPKALGEMNSFAAERGEAKW